MPQCRVRIPVTDWFRGVPLLCEQCPRRFNLGIARPENVCWLRELWSPETVPRPITRTPPSTMNDATARRAVESHPPIELAHADVVRISSQARGRAHRFGPARA